jgi:2-polyprenyl-3-methyl-5-hydroxy-6-metoxy-1,4-benzoquinol methylase
VSDATRNPNDPRWGQERRESKAEAILKTMQIHTGQELTEAIWLDIGCGSGGIAATLAAHVRQVIGVDPESWERWQNFRAAHPNLAFHKGSYRDLDRLLGPDSIDVVVCNQVYEHVDDPVALLRAIHDALKPGGLCYFAGPNLLWPIEPHVFWPFVHWLPRGLAQRAMRWLGSQHAAELDAHSTNYWRLRTWFRDVGFMPRNAIAARIEAGFAGRGKTQRLPHWFAAIIDVLAPLSPGFVFGLRKP